MSVQTIVVGTRLILLEKVGPLSQACPDTTAVAVTGGDIDARGWITVAITVLCVDETITWIVYGAHASDFSDEVVVQVAADILADAVGFYTASPAPFGYYRAKVVNKVAESVGSIVYNALAKR